MSVDLNICEVFQETQLNSQHIWVLLLPFYSLDFNPVWLSVFIHWAGTLIKLASFGGVLESKRQIPTKQRETKQMVDADSVVHCFSSSVVLNLFRVGSPSLTFLNVVVPLVENQSCAWLISVLLNLVMLPPDWEACAYTPLTLCFSDNKPKVGRRGSSAVDLSGPTPYIVSYGERCLGQVELSYVPLFLGGVWLWGLDREEL